MWNPKPEILRRPQRTRYQLGVVAVFLLTAVAGLFGQQLAKEYIYVGGRLLAVEVAPPPPGGVSISITPLPDAPEGVSLSSGGSHGFQATVTGATNTAVTWKILPDGQEDGPGCLTAEPPCEKTSTANPVTYYAPASITAEDSAVLRVTSDEDPNRSTLVTIQLVPFSVAINPAPGPLSANQTHTFTLDVDGITFSNAVWEVANGPGGFTSSTVPAPGSGEFKAPPCIPVATTSEIKVTLDANPNWTDTALVNLTGGTSGCGTPDPAQLALTALTSSPPPSIPLGILRLGVTIVGVSFTVQSTGPASGVTLQLYLSNSPTSASEDLVHTLNLGSISASSLSGSTSFLVPSNATPGANRHLVGRVFYSGEQEDANNVRLAASYQVNAPVGGTPGTPELVPNTYIVTPTVTTAEIPQIIGGTGNLGGDVLIFTSQEPQRLKMRVALETNPQQILNLQQSTDPNAVHYLPGPTQGPFANPLPTWWPLQAWSPVTSPGFFNVRTTVNTGTGSEKITEQNPSNNEAVQPLVVIVPSAPDLMPASLDLSSAGDEPGSTVNLTSVIENMGSGGAAQTFRAGFYLSEDSIITIGDQLLNQCDALSVPSPGQDVTCSRAVTIPSSTSPGNRFLGVLVDDIGGDYGQVAEALETNNRASDPFTVNGPPQATLVSPTAGTGATVSFTARYADVDGGNDLASSFLLLNSTLSEVNACKVAYDQFSGQLRLYDDSGSSIEGAVAVDSGVSVSNSQCTLEAPILANAPSVNGTELAVIFDIEFTAAFVGSKKVYLRADDLMGATSGWIEKGSWTVAAAGPDNAPTISINSPSAGSNWVDSKTPINWTANDDNGVDSCQLTLDGTVIPYPVCGNGSPTEMQLSNVHIPDTAKLLALDFADNTGSTTYDRSGNAYDGTLNNGVVWTTGQYGVGLSFDGVDDYVSFGDVLDFNGTDTFSFSFWIKPAAFDRFLIAKQDNWEYGQGYSIYLLTDGRIQLSMIAYGGVASLKASSSTSVALNSWSHVVVTNDGSSDPSGIKFYINGVLATTFEVSDTLGSTSTTTSEPFHIGCREACSFKRYEGAMDEVSAYNRILSSAEAADIFNDAAFDGSHTLTATVFDTANQTGQHSVAFTIGSTSQAPSIVSVTPTGSTGLRQVFSFVYSDPNGYTDITQVRADIAVDNQLPNACYFRFTPATNELILSDDDHSFLLGPSVISSGSDLVNSQCRLHVATSSASGSGNNLTLNVDIEFDAGYAGPKGIYAWMVDSAVLTDGWEQIGTWTVGTVPSNVPPTVNSATPNSGTGLQQSFEFAFSDPNGYADITQAEVNFAIGNSFPNGCYVRFDHLTNQVELRNDADSAWSAASALGTGTDLSNSQCTVDISESSASGTGNDLTLTLGVSFEETYAGAQPVYARVEDSQAQQDGWDQLGTWTVDDGSNDPPSIVSVTPNTGTGLRQVFSFVFSDSDGYTDITQVRADIAANNELSNACYFRYTPATNELTLSDDDHSFLVGSSVVGSGADLINSQCRLHVSTSSVSTSGSDLTLNVDIEFDSGYAGAKGAYAWMVDTGTLIDGWEQLGAWTVGTAPSNDPPTVNSVSPNTGTGLQQSFAFSFSDTDGHADIGEAEVNFAVGNTVSNACYVRYDPVSNQVELRNDADSAWTGPSSLGTGTDLSNSQCTIDVSDSLASGTGNDLTLTLDVEFDTSYEGTQPVYARVEDSQAQQDGWDEIGSWTVGSVAFTESGGLVQMEAENGTIVNRTQSWVFGSSQSGYLGTGYVAAEPNTGTNQSSGYVGVSPEVQFDVNFSTTGTYYVWMRGYSASGSDNTAHVGLNGQVVSSSESIAIDTYGVWHWTGITSSEVRATLTISTPGIHTVNVWMREDGLLFDKLVLTTDSELDPAQLGGNQAPSVGSVAPSSGTGPEESFEFSFSDPDGYGDIAEAEVNFAVSNSSSNACYVRFDPSSNEVELRNDTDSAWSAASVLGTGSDLSNSQCTIDILESSASGAGNNLTLTINVEFDASYEGVKPAYARVEDSQALEGGWEQVGTWTVDDSVNDPPSIDSVTPNSGTGMRQIFSFAFSDPDGYADIVQVRADIAVNNELSNACYFRYVQATNELILSDDDHSFLVGSSVIGSGADLVNSQCRLHVSTSSVSGSGEDLTLNVDIEFDSSYVGAKGIYAIGWDTEIQTVGWDQIGTWTVGQ